MKRSVGWLAAIAGVLAAWVAFDLLVWGYGESPRVLLPELLDGTWGTAYGVGQVLFKATPLLFAGAAVHVALRAGLFNIGAEGQITVASLVVAVLGARLSPSANPWLASMVLAVAAMGAGAAWAAIPAVLRARYGAHEVISTIMMNRIADAMVGFALVSGLAEPGTARTPAVSAAARLPRLDAWLPKLHGSAASVAFLVAIVVAGLAVASGSRTRIGREIGLVGENPVACAQERIPVARRLVQAMLLSGALAGLAATGTVLGYKGYYEQGLGAGAGFTGLAVALMGRGTLAGLVGAALLFGTLAQGGLAINGRVPMEVMTVLEGIVLVAVALADQRVRAAILARVGRREEGAS